MKKREVSQIEATAKYLDTLVNAVEQVRSGKLAPDKLNELVEQMKVRIDDIAKDFPSISKDLKSIKSDMEGPDPVKLMESGLNIYKDTFKVLNLFLTEAKSEHLEEGLKSAKEAHNKFLTIHELISRVTGL